MNLLLRWLFGPSKAEREAEAFERLAQHRRQFHEKLAEIFPQMKEWVDCDGSCGDPIPHRHAPPGKEIVIRD